MWVPEKALDWLQASKASVDGQREDIAALRADNARLTATNSSLTIMNDWLRMQVNQLQLERTGLMERAYGIKISAPEIVRSPTLGQAPNMSEFSFEDVGDEVARKLGFPVYGDIKQ